MKFVEPYVEYMGGTEYAAEIIEKAARNCYQSEPAGNRNAFLLKLLGMGHLSVFEHASATFRIVADRGVSHELVRHRIGVAYSQESTRFCDYSGNGISVVQPHFESTNLGDRWHEAMSAAEGGYQDLRDNKVSPQIARAVLPTCLKTEVVTTMTYHAWMHFLDLRYFGLTGIPHPQMRKVAGMILAQLKEIEPVIFSKEAFETRWEQQEWRLHCALKNLDESFAQLDRMDT